jgi:hypothetical protein
MEKEIDFDWRSMRLEVMAALALNGMLSNPATYSLPPEVMAKKSKEYADALDVVLSGPQETKGPEPGLADDGDL